LLAELFCNGRNLRERGNSYHHLKTISMKIRFMIIREDYD
jgi:hypothetical protein